MLYLSSATIQSYAALIAIPLTISAVHLSRMYEAALPNVLLKESKKIFAVYSIIVIVSIFNIIINPTTPESMIVMLTLQLAVCILPIYPLLKELLNLLTISPIKIMEFLGYPQKVQKLVNEGKFFETQNRLFKGLSLIRSCIIDMSLRDYLASVVKLYATTLSGFHWANKKIDETRKEGRIDMETLCWSILNLIDENVISPIENTKILPNPHTLYPLLKEINVAMIDTSMLNSSVFDDYLEEMSKLTEIYVEKRKTKHSNLFLYSIFWSIKEKNEPIPPILISRAISLSAALIKKVEKFRGEDFLYISMFTNEAFYAIKDDPKSFARLDSEAIDAWISLIENGDRMNLSPMIISLSSVEKYLKKIKEQENEFIYKRALGNFIKIKSKIKEKNIQNRWVVFVDKNAINILSINDNTISSHGVKNILKNDELKILRSFVDRNFKDLSK